MGEEEFIDELTARLRTEDSIYRTMARDIYQSGTVLQHKKYRMLGWAYRIFLVGLVASCAAYRDPVLRLIRLTSDVPSAASPAPGTIRRSP